VNIVHVDIFENIVHWVVSLVFDLFVSAGGVLLCVDVYGIRVGVHGPHILLLENLWIISDVCIFL